MSLLRLGAALRARGAECRLLTFRWQRDWPERIEHHGISIVRLPRPTKGFWGTLAHIRRIEHWIASECAPGTIICTSGMRHEAVAVVRAGRKVGAAVLLRPEGAGLTGDCFWQLDARFGRHIKRICMSADSFLAPTRAVEQELIAAGYARGRIRYLSSGIPDMAAATAEMRRVARRNLAGAHAALTATDDACVLLYAGRLDAAKGLLALVEAWQPISFRRPSARLWIVGEGPAETELRSQIRTRGLVSSVILPGAFDNLEDFWSASNAYVAPAVEAGSSTALLEAMAAGLPVVASDIPGHHEFIEHERQGLLVPQEIHAELSWQRMPHSGKPAAAPIQALSDAIERLWGAPELCDRLGQAARQRASQEHSLERKVDEFQLAVEFALDHAAYRSPAKEP